jgi:hypothetical protein
MSFVQQNTFAPQAPKQSFPYSFSNPASLANTLASIGFPLSAKIKALAAAGQPLGRSGEKIDIHSLDQVLKNYDIDTRRRLQLKCEMTRQGLL